MRCFDYPFDPAFILQKKRALRRELLASEGLVPKKVAILSGSTVGEIKNILEPVSYTHLTLPTNREV